MSRPDGMRVIGLTGGIATGKSSVARLLEQHGVLVIDADQLARDVVEPGTATLDKISELFGPDSLLPDGQLDRAGLRKKVFTDPVKRIQLEQIIHPEIRRLAEERIAEAAAQGRRVIFYMAPLLIEAGAQERVDEVWVVTVSPEIQLQRLMARDNLEESEARRIIDSQMPLVEKARYGRVVIDNSGTREETRHLVDALWLQEMGEQ